MTTITKRCAKCKREYPATLQYFHHHKGRKDGLHAWCIECKRIGETDRNRRYYENNREKVINSSKVYAEKHPEKQHARHHKWYLANKELSNQRSRENQQRLRKQVIEVYGGKCQCCGETQYEFLAIDHIDGGGREHRRQLKWGSVYRWLRDNGYPEGFQVLCHNCNMAKAFYGICPHQR